MMLTKEALELMDLEELKLLEQSVKAVIKKKERANKKEFEFYFEGSANTAKRKNPYVARLYMSNGKLEREFKNLERSYGEKEVTVYGNYTAKVGDIIEKRIGVNGKEEQRFWFLINNDGSEVKVADFANAKQKQRVISYFKKEITKEELIRDVRQGT